MGKVLYPLKFLYLPWIFVIILFFIPVFYYEEIELKTWLFILIFFISIISGYILGFSTINHNKRYGDNNIFYIVKIVIFFSILYIILKVFSLGGEITLSINQLTESRYDKIRSGAIKGSSFIGILSSSLSGFPIISLILLIYLKFHSINITKIQTKILYAVIILGMVLSISGGGRNSLLIFLFVIFILNLIHKFKYKRNKKVISIIKSINKYAYIFILISFFLVFSIIISRIDYKEDNYNINKTTYLEYSYGVDINYSIKSTILSVPGNLSLFTEAFLNFYYYFTHSIQELNKTLNSSPDNFPYWGAYQYYTITLFLNKFGAKFIDIDQILAEIVNPGKYTTFIGSSYLDFGNYCFIYFLFIGFFIGKMWNIFLYKRSFINTAYTVMLLILLVASPIYGYIGIGAFLPLILNLILVDFLNRF